MTFSPLKIAPILVIFLVILSAYSAGYGMRDQKARAQISQLKLAQQEKEIQAEKAYSAKLQEAVAAQQDWLTRADEVSRRQSEAEKTLSETANNLKKGIDHAVKKDQEHGCTPGLGVSSLHIYRKALGY